MEDIEKFLNDEIREMKRKTFDNRARTGSRSGYKGKMYLTSDLLTGKAKRDYIKGGKVEVFNMYEVMNYQDFLLLDDENRKKRLEEWTKTHTVNEIADKWEKTYKATYSHFNRLGVSIVKKSPRGRTGERTKRKYNKKETTPKQEVQTSANLPAIVEKKLEEVQEKPNGFSFSFNGEYSAEEIVKKLEKMGLILSDEEGEFKIELNVKELETV